MLKQSCMLFVAMTMLAVWGTAYAAGKGETGIERGIIIIGGRITNISGKLVTIKDQGGTERVFEVGSTAGLRVGAPVLCEEDCGKQMRVGDRVVNVQRVIKR